MGNDGGSPFSSSARWWRRELTALTVSRVPPYLPSFSWISHGWHFIYFSLASPCFFFFGALYVHKLSIYSFNRWLNEFIFQIKERNIFDICLISKWLHLTRKGENGRRPENTTAFTFIPSSCIHLWSWFDNRAKIWVYPTFSFTTHSLLVVV